MLKKGMLLLVVLMLLMPDTVLAAETKIQCEQGDTIEAVFQLAPGSGKPDVVVGQLEYDHDLFEGMFAGLMSVTPQGGVYMYNGNAVAVPFRVNRYAPAGTYTISIRVIEARDSQGKLMADVSVLPVEVTVRKEKSVMQLPTAAPQPTAARFASPASDFKYEVQNGKATVTGYSGSAKDVVIPDVLGGYPVGAIGDKAFAGNKTMISVDIPDGVESIGWISFNDCTKLKRVRLPSSVKTIGYLSFQSCSSLTDITLPEGLQNISNSAFNLCDSLTSINIPDSLVNLDSNPFRSCKKLREINISAGHPSLEVKNGVLYNKAGTILICCPNGLQQKKFSIPAGIKTIFAGLYCRCRSLGFGALGVSWRSSPSYHHSQSCSPCHLSTLTCQLSSVTSQDSFCSELRSGLP